MTLVRGRSVKEVAEFVQARVLGDETVQLTGIASVQSAGPGDLIFVDDEKNFLSALESRAAAVIAGEFATGKPSSKPLLLASRPRLPNFFALSQSKSPAFIPAQSCIRRRDSRAT
jgi:UDP-3-O-[3-hydroxymyristoyl] glucosamine N-acyltransferase